MGGCVGVGVCVCVYVCVILPPPTSRPQNIGAYGFTVTRRKLTILIFTKNYSFRSYASFTSLNATNYT